MKPTNLHTRIFLDSADPAETKIALERLGFLDGQTTNPALLAKHPKFAGGVKMTLPEIQTIYKEAVTEIRALLPGKSVSMQVFDTGETSVEELLAEAREKNSWIPGAHIKFPFTKTALEAAKLAYAEGINVNMTLCFTLEQAGLAGCAFPDAKDDRVYLSPYIGRLEDKGLDGIDNVINALRLYKENQIDIKVLAASVRTIDDLHDAFSAKADIVTAPLALLLEWADAGFTVNDTIPRKKLEDIAYTPYSIPDACPTFSIDSPFTTAGLTGFVKAINELVL